MRSNDPPVQDGENSADKTRQRSGRANEIRTTLQEEIERGVLPPGASLDERALALRFQVSRTPVREALQQLAARGQVRIAPRQGVSVTRLTVSQIRAIMESIGELESLAAKLAARRVDEHLRRELESAVKRCEDAAWSGGAAEYSIANTLFHEAIYAGTRNAYLAELIRHARQQMLRYRLSDFQTKTLINKSLQDHIKVARAIQDGDEDLAAQSMLAHVPGGSTGFSEFLAHMPASFVGADVEP